MITLHIYTPKDLFSRFKRWCAKLQRENYECAITYHNDIVLERVKSIAYQKFNNVDAYTVTEIVKDCLNQQVQSTVAKMLKVQ